MTWTFYLILTFVIVVCSSLLGKEDFDRFTKSIEENNIDWKNLRVYLCILCSVALGLYLLPVMLPAMAAKAVVKYVISPVLKLFTKGA